MNIENMQYTYITENCYDITGFTREEHLQLSAYETLPAEFIEKATSILRRELIRMIKEELTDYSGIVIELQRYHKDGHQF